MFVGAGVLEAWMTLVNSGPNGNVWVVLDGVCVGKGDGMRACEA